MDVLGDQSRDHVHDVVPVVTEGAQSLHGPPGLGWIIGEELVRNDLVHRYVQSWAERLAVDGHLVTALERVCEFAVERLDQQHAIVLAIWVYQLEVDLHAGTVP